MPDPRKLVTPLLEGLLKPMKRLDETFQPIKTFHASPHDFDTVDLRKVGSGQGAQMYGHGFYSAQSPEVSGVGGAYWHEFKDKRFGDFVPHNEQFDRDIEKLAANILEQHKYDRQAAANQARKFADDISAAQTPQHPMIDRLQRAADKLESGAQVGPRVYETHLYARPEDYLDWDKPLTGQSKGVQSGLENVGGWSTRYRTDWRGEDIYKAIAQSSGGGRVGQKVATENLADVGIPGVRYLDQHSRAAWEAPQRLKDIERQINELQSDLMNPEKFVYSKDVDRSIAQLEKERDYLTKKMSEATYNYVTGNTDIIDLAKKFAVPGALATGALPYLGNEPVQTRY